MAITRITKGVIKPNENYDTHNIVSTGIVTSVGLDVNGNADVSGNLSVGGVLTYEDVTSIDSVGIITAQKGIHVGAGISAVGIITAATFKGDGDFVDIDVDGHTNLDNVSVAGVSTFSDTLRVGAGVTIHTSGESAFAGVSTFYGAGGGTGAAIHIPANKALVLGENYLYGSIYNSGSQLNFRALNSYRFRVWDGGGMEEWLTVTGPGGTILLGGSTMGVPNPNKTPGIQLLGASHQIKMLSSAPGSTTLTERFRLSQSGINFTGLSTHTGNFDLDGDLDVDGHTNLDNVSVAGILTATSSVHTGTNLQVNSDIGKLKLGASQDFELYHNGTDSYIDNNTGDLYIQTTGSGDDILIESADDFTVKTATKTAIEAVGDGAVKIYHNGSTNPKIYTNSIGVTIDNVLYISGPAGNPGRLRFQEGGALSEIRGVRNTDNNSLLYFDTEISGTTATRMMINGSGHLRAATDSTYDLGTNAVRWRNVYADTYYGDGSNLTGITGTTINGNTDHRIVTATGTANTLQGESGLTFNGSVLHLNSGGNGLPRIRLQHTGSSNDIFEITSGITGVSNGGFGIIDIDENVYRFAINSSGNIGVNTPTPIGTLDVYDGSFVLSKPNASGNERNWRFLNNNVAAGNLGLQVSTAAGGSTFSNLVEITKNGYIGIGEGTPDRRLHLKNPAQIKLESTDTGNWSGLEFMASSGTNNYDAYMGMNDSDGKFFIDNNSNGHDFVIDRDGRVTTPSTTSFYATANSGGTVSMTSTHTLTNWRLSTSGKTYDIGSNFNTSNGRFTAPVSGKYLFTASILLAGYDQASDIHMMWRKNGTTMQYWYNTRTSNIDRSGYGGYLAQGSTTTFTLSANDYIDIACVFSGSLSLWCGDSNWGHFSGHLLG